MLEAGLLQLLGDLRDARVCVLSGAGISAESGIPTFRGKEGYWTVGSRNYMPEEMATARQFARHPEEVWRWYLYRFGICRHAQPNAAHRALVELEQGLGDRFALVTQNIDGLHRRAGTTAERCFCIHGEAALVRCADDCGIGRLPLPDLGQFDAQTTLSEAHRKALHCPRCGAWLRPHVLWFDECYDEENYRAESAMNAAAEADLLLVIGTSGATNLPSQIGALCLRLGAVIVDINPESNPFSELAERARRGAAVKSRACEAVPRVVEALLGRA